MSHPVLLHLPFTLLLVLIALGTGPLHAQVGRSEIFHDSLRNREDRREYRQERQEWIELINRAAPGVDVSLVNDGIRHAKRMLREKNGVISIASAPTVNLGGGLLGTWSERGSRNQAGRTHLATIDWIDRTIYVAADGGQIWKGSLEGEGWRSLNDPLALRSIRLLETSHRGDQTRLIVVGNNYAYTADPDGNEWVESAGLDQIARWGGFTRGVMSQGEHPTIYMVGEEWDYEENWEAIGVLYRSTDLGRTFERAAIFAEHRMLDVWSPPGEEWAYVLVGDTLGRIGPEGEMTVVNPAIELEGGFGGVTALNLRGAPGGIFALHVTRGGTYEMQISGDGGMIWGRTGSIPTGLFSRYSFAIDPENPSRMVVGSIEVYFSEDAGFNWKKVNDWEAYYANPKSMLHADIPFIDYDYSPEGERTLFVSTDGGLYRSDDNLTTVRNLSLSGLGASQYYSVYTSRVDTNVIFAGAQDQGFQRSIVDHGGILDFDQTISGDYGHIQSGDGGKSIWTNYPGFSMYYPSAIEKLIGSNERRDFPTTGHLWIPPLVVDPDTASTAWVAGGETPEYRGAHLIRMAFRSDRGQIVASIHPFDFSRGSGGVRLTSLAISPVDHDRWYAVTSDNRFWISTDHGATWDDRAGWDSPGGHYFYGNALVPSKSDPETIWVAGSGYSGPGVWVSHDNGITFDSISDGLPPTLVYDLDASRDGSLLFAATAVGPYVYLADSGRWYDASGGVAPDQTWWSVDYIEENRLVRFGTYGRGIWDLRLSDAPSNGVDLPTAPTAPALELEVRPLADQVEFLISSPITGEGSLEVYDLNGRRVATLHRGRIEAGRTRLEWDRHATGGRILPPGHYFCIVLLGGSVAFNQIDLH